MVRQGPGTYLTFRLSLYPSLSSSLPLSLSLILSLSLSLSLSHTHTHQLTHTTHIVFYSSTHTLSLYTLTEIDPNGRKNVCIIYHTNFGVSVCVCVCVCVCLCMFVCDMHCVSHAHRHSLCQFFS